MLAKSRERGAGGAGQAGGVLVVLEPFLLGRWLKA